MIPDDLEQLADDYEAWHQEELLYLEQLEMEDEERNWQKTIYKTWDVA